MAVKCSMQGRTQIDTVGYSIIVRGRKRLNMTRIHQVTVGCDIDTQTRNTATVIVCFADFPFECRTADKHFLFQTLFVKRAFQIFCMICSSLLLVCRRVQYSYWKSHGSFSDIQMDHLFVF